MSSILSNPVYSTGSESEGQTLFNFLKAKISHAKKCQLTQQNKKNEKPKTQKEKIRAIKNAKRERQNATKRFNALGELMHPEHQDPEHTENTENEEKLLKIISALNAKDQTEIKTAWEKLQSIAQNDINAYFVKSNTGFNAIDAKTTADNKNPSSEVQAVDTIENFYPASFFTGDGLKNFKARPQTKSEMIGELCQIMRGKN